MSADKATAPPQLRPLALGEIIDVSIKLMRRNWRTPSGPSRSGRPGAVWTSASSRAPARLAIA
ncbi:MAG: hypothetical protein QOH72_3659 [Solirubrobacteraceae bacterium]|jgi:hypothetical protein|nr:hypothetical protein [Solirubrobacteraceae bacterium]